VTYTDTCDVPTLVGAALGVNDRTAKRKLSRIAVKKMTKARLDERDPGGELLGWFSEILQRCH
jgi:putative ATP-dependent endonuclease of the OLD family